MTLDQQFNAINDKLQLLLRSYARLQKENERLKEELLQAQQREMAGRQGVDDLQQQIAILRMAAGELDDRGKKEFDKKIGQYIKEIDRCISFLSQ
jgi:uncharacterized small protein (DUF1192 family)